MGRIILVLGILLIAAGVIGTATSSFLPSDFGSSLQLATDPKTREAKLCKPGETLIEENGATTYTPGRGYASTAILYCENSEGQRREVTGEFANQMLGQVTNIVSGVFSGLGRTFLFTGLTVLGVILLVIGAIATSRKRRLMTSAFGNPVIMQSYGGSADIASLIQQAQAMKNNPGVTVMGGTGGNDLKARLSQLEEARKAGLLSQEEFDRLRQQILDALK